MGHHKHLPFNIKEYQETDIIDMSSLDFNTDNKVRSAFIFIRNMHINPIMDFSKCTFEQVSDYLIEYLFGDISVFVPFLINTWIEILLFGSVSRTNLPSIFGIEYIEQFIDKHKEKVSALKSVIASTPLAAIQNIIEYDDSFEITDESPVNFDNLLHIINHSDFMLIFLNSIGHPVKFYNKYFNNNTWYQQALGQMLPFVQLAHTFSSVINDDPIIQNLNEVYNKGGDAQDETDHS